MEGNFLHKTCNRGSNHTMYQLLFTCLNLFFEEGYSLEYKFKRLTRQGSNSGTGCLPQGLASSGGTSGFKILHADMVYLCKKVWYVRKPDVCCVLNGKKCGKRRQRQDREMNEGCSVSQIRFVFQSSSGHIPY